MVDTNKKQKTVRRPIRSLRRRQMWMTTLLGAAILISGIGIGFGSTLAYLGRSKQVATTEESPQPTKVAIAITNDVKDNYGLDEQQTGKVRGLMLKRLEALKVIRTKAMDEMLVVHRAIREDMREVLTPDQFQRWEKHNEEARNRSKFRHRPWGRGSQRGDRDGRGKHNGRGGPHGQDKGRPGGMSEMFKRLDKDNSGDLTKDEIEYAPGQVPQFIQKADINGDGKVDREEFKTQLRRRRPPPPGRDRKPRDRKDRDPSSAPAQDLSML